MGDYNKTIDNYYYPFGFSRISKYYGAGIRLVRCRVI